MANLIFTMASGGTLESTTSQSTVTFGSGRVVTLDRNMPVGQFANGEPFIVADEDFNITSWTPASSGNQNGVVLNPDANDTDQGFDIAFENQPAFSSSTSITYTNSRNVDPGNTGSNLFIASGTNASYVKGIRVGGYSAGNNAVIEYYDVLTILATTPLENPYRPGIAGTTKVIRTRADVDFDSHRNYTAVADQPAIADVLTDIPANLALFTDMSESHRYFRLENAMSGFGDDGYSAKLVTNHAQYIYALNSSAPSASERQEIIDRIITFGNDIEANINEGAALAAGAGQGGCLWLWGMAAAALLKDETLHQLVRSNQMQPETPFWVDAAKTTETPNLGKNNNSPYGQVYLEEQIGAPWIEPEQISSSHTSRYVHHSGRIVCSEVAAVASIGQGPSGKDSGFAMILDGANDTTNQKAAIYAYANSYSKWTPTAQNSYPPTGWHTAVMSQLATFSDVTPATYQPDQPPNAPGADLDDNYFTAGDGQITLNTQGIDYATETITQTDMRVSLDGVQFIENNNITLSSNQYTWTGLLRGATHWAGWRRRSASGAGAWSAHFPHFSGGASANQEKSKVTTSGTETNAVPSYGANTPVIHARKYPQWFYEAWEPTSGTLGLDDVELSAGVGYPSGFPAPTYAFQWQRSADGSTGWANITGGGSKKYNRQAADASQFLRCNIIPSNSEGSGAAQPSNVVECPALSTIPAGTLIDTDFSGRFQVDYESEFDSITTGANDWSHIQAGTYAAMDGIASPAFLLLEKNGTSGEPFINFELSRAVTPGQVYDIDVEYAAIWIRNPSGGDSGTEYRIVIRNAANGAEIWEAVATPAADAEAATITSPFNANDELYWFKKTVSGSFTVPSGVTQLEVRSTHGYTSGQSFGGNQALYSLHIREQ